MEQIIYVKYNRIRRPEFATRTAMIRDAADGSCKVKKTALYPEGEAHIKSFSDKEELMKRLYRNVRVIPVTEDGGSVFPFIKGTSVAGELEKHMTGAEELVGHLQAFLDETMDYDPELRLPFSPTEEFSEVFGETDYRGEAVRIANVDGIPDNFLRTEDGLVLIDYEWVFDFPVPEPFIRYRTLYYFLAKNYSIITGIMTEDEYFESFGYSKKERKRWARMDDRFQEYVHGPGRCHNYPVSFEKTVHDINYLLNHVSDIGGERHRLIMDGRKLGMELEKMGELRSFSGFARYKMDRLRKR